ncbi:MAG: hypothetical protein K2G55_16000 [Lachnospiraceae bacterium]|nr:hypothetical protein [Lachnospiraceae bacterium]MDE7202190.1 hypothetical protein [Lachnospiraceae bacterium]
MTKNIIVVDEHGKKYGTTYLKRAKGLVKQGRARFLARNMLCLACPPEQNLEDKEMSEQTIENSAAENNMVDEEKANMEQGGSKYSMEYCLTQIERIAHQTEYLNQVISELRQMDDNSCQTKAIALGDIVKCRETTNQQILRFYEKMYDDLKGPGEVDVVTQKTHLQEQLLKIMDKTLENGDFLSNEISDMFNGAFDAIRHING